MGDSGSLQPEHAAATDWHAGDNNIHRRCSSKDLAISIENTTHPHSYSGTCRILPDHQIAGHLWEEGTNSERHHFIGSVKHIICALLCVEERGRRGWSGYSAEFGDRSWLHFVQNNI